MASTAAAVPSCDPSSTTINSIFGQVCRRTDRTAFSIVASRLKAGMTTEINSGSTDVFILGAPSYCDVALICRLETVPA